MVIEESETSKQLPDYNLFPMTVNRREEGGSPLKFDADIMVHAATSNLSDLIKAHSENIQ